MGANWDHLCGAHDGATYQNLNVHTMLLKTPLLKSISGDSLAVQCLELCALTAEGPGSIPGGGTKILEATWHGQKKTKKSISQVQSRAYRTTFVTITLLIADN